MWPNPQFTTDLVTITEEILNGKLHFLCSDTHSVRSIFWIKSLAWNFLFNANTWIVLLVRIKALALVTLINYIANYVTSTLLITFWYYLLAPVANLWKKTHLDRYVPVPLEQSLFYQICTLIIDLWLLLAQLKNFCYYKQGLI